MSDNGSPRGDQRPEVEIIPPDRNRARSGRAQSRVWISIDTSRGQTRGASGLFGIIVAILLVTFVMAVVLVAGVIPYRWRDRSGRAHGPAWTSPA